MKRCVLHLPHGSDGECPLKNGGARGAGGMPIQQKASPPRGICIAPLCYAMPRNRFCDVYTHHEMPLCGLPRRRGRRAVPAWQTCRAGVANSKAPSAHSKVPWRNGFAPYRNGCKWLRNSGSMCRISAPPLAVRFPAPLSTPKSGEKRRCEAWDNRLRAQEACADGLAYTPPGHGGEGARRLAAACEEAIGKRMRGR